jgi:hypothetical protein
MQFMVKNHRDGTLTGPYSAKAIVDRVEAGSISGNSFTQRTGETEWITINTLFGFCEKPQQPISAAPTVIRQHAVPAFLPVEPVQGAPNPNLRILRNSALFAAAGAIGTSIGVGAPLIICFILFFLMFLVAHLLGFPWIKKRRQ